MKSNRKCGVCGAKNMVKNFHTLNFKLYEEITLPDSYNIVMCVYCGFIFADTSATQEDYNLFYENNNIYENDASYSDKEKYKMTYDVLKNHWTRDKSILEIGFANGELLNLFKADGHVNLYGLDLSKVCVDNLNSQGIKAYHGGLLNHNIDRKFDCIILSHVMEHIMDLKQAIKNAFDLLEDDGELYIEVPDFMQYIENSDTPFSYFDIEHINHFDINTLTQFMSNNNFNVKFSGTKKWAIGDNKFYPAVWVLSKKTDNTKTEYATKYVDNCLNNKYIEIEELIKSQEEIIVWGTGSLTQRMYSMSGLDKCNINMFVDNSPLKIGKSFCGKVIQKPSDIKDNIPILILCVYYTGDIIKQILGMNLPNKVITIEEKII